MQRSIREPAVAGLFYPADPVVLARAVDALLADAAQHAVTDRTRRLGAVLAEAGPSQVLVTRTVRDLATGTDVELRPLGEVELRGVPGGWELFEARQR